MSGIRIRITESHDESRRIYEQTRSLETARKFEWLYERNPEGRAQVYLAEDDASGRTVGTLTILPMRFWCEGETIAVGQALDGIVLPEFRGRNIFTRFLESAARDLADRYRFFIGFPNTMSVGGLLKMGWTRAGFLDTASLLLRGSAIARKLSLPNPVRVLAGLLLSPPVAALRGRAWNAVNTSGYSLSPLEPWSADLDAVVDAVRRRHPVFAARTREYVQWRLTDIPVREYLRFQIDRDGRRIGYAAVSGTGPAGELIDFMVEPEHAAPAAKVVARECLNRGMDSLHVQVNKESYCMDAFCRIGAGERRTPTPVMVFPLSERVVVPPFDRWFVSRADTDWL